MLGVRPMPKIAADLVYAIDGGWFARRADRMGSARGTGNRIPIVDMSPNADQVIRSYGTVVVGYDGVGDGRSGVYCIGKPSDNDGVATLCGQTSIEKTKERSKWN